MFSNFHEFPFVVAFLINFTVIKEHALYDFSYFKFVKICFMVHDMVFLCICFMETAIVGQGLL